MPRRWRGERRRASQASVIGSLYPAVTVLLAMVLLGERVHRQRQIGLVLALAAVALIAAA